METRDYTIDSDIVQDNSIGGEHKEWASNGTAPETANKITQDLTEYMGKVFYPNIVRERDELRVENQENKDKMALMSKDLDDYKELASKQVLEIHRCQQQIKKLQELFNVQANAEVVVTTNMQEFVFDVVHFDEFITIDQINTMFLNLQKLTEIMIAPDKYLINNASAVVPIYILLTKSKKIPGIYHYKGTMSDFCKEWNSNVASRISDKKRSQALTCDYVSFKAEYNRAPWKGSSPANWKRDMVDSKHKVKIDRAVNTKKHMERLFT